MHAKTKPTTHATSNNLATLVLDEVLDAAACNAMRRFQRHAQRVSQTDTAIDLRRTRTIGSAAWATLVKAVRDLKRNGHEVTVIASKRLQALLHISEVMRHAHIVIAAEL